MGMFWCKPPGPRQMQVILPCTDAQCLNASSPADLMLHNIGATCILVYPFIFPHPSDNICFILHAAHQLPLCQLHETVPLIHCQEAAMNTPSRYIPNSSKSSSGSGCEHATTCPSLTDMGDLWTLASRQQPACLDMPALC